LVIGLSNHCAGHNLGKKRGVRRALLIGNNLEKLQVICAIFPAAISSSLDAGLGLPSSQFCILF